ADTLFKLGGHAGDAPSEKRAFEKHVPSGAIDGETNLDRTAIFETVLQRGSESRATKRNHYGQGGCEQDAEGDATNAAVGVEQEECERGCEERQPDCSGLCGQDRRRQRNQQRDGPQPPEAAAPKGVKRQQAKQVECHAIGDGLEEGSASAIDVN